MTILRACILIFLLGECNPAFSQSRFAALDSLLTLKATQMPNLNQKVESSVNSIDLNDFITGIAIANALDITLSADIKIVITSSFSNASVKDVLLFLCRKYNLDLIFIGNIIAIEKYNSKTENLEKKRKPIAEYDSIKGTLSYDFRFDSLIAVSRVLSDATGKNFVLSPAVNNKIISGYLKNTPLKDAVDMLAYSNGFSAKNVGNQYLLCEAEEKSSNTTIKKYSTKSTSTDNSAYESIKISTDSLGKVNISSSDGKLQDIIEAVSMNLGINYFIASEISGTTSIDVNGASYTDLMDALLTGTEYGFTCKDDFYVFGNNDMEGLRETKVLKLNYRSVDKITDYIPTDLKKNLDIKEFPELNSIILCGSPRVIAEVDSFLFTIDKTVPLILIEVLIVESKRSHNVSTGLSAGINNDMKKSTVTGGTLYPTVDLTLDANSINNIIAGLNGFGWVNLGNVTSKFFTSLQAMEENGSIKVNSTPKLATLNGNEATLSIGNTEYYLEETNNLIATQSTQNITTRQYKSVNADLTLTIKPFVSGDEQITMNIDVTQSDFTARISPNAPPGSVSRSFSSLIRVKNSEMVLLGGLEKRSLSSAGTGVPFLARIPVIKWFFSSQQKDKSKSKLNLFIRPTVIY